MLNNIKKIETVVNQYITELEEYLKNYSIMPKFKRNENYFNI